MSATGSSAPTCGDQPSGQVANGVWMIGALVAKSDACMVCLLGFKFFKLHLFPWFVSLTLLTLEIPGRFLQKPHVRYALWNIRCARELYDQLLLGGIGDEIRAYKNDGRFKTLHAMAHQNVTPFAGHCFWACVLAALDPDDDGEASWITGHTQGGRMEGFMRYSSKGQLIASFGWYLLFGLQLISCHCWLAIGFVGIFKVSR